MNRFKHFYLIFLPAVFVIMFAYACQDNTTEPIKQTNELAGQILDEQEVPVPNAIIQVFSSGSGIQGLIDKDTTDEDGLFKLSGVPERLDNLNMRIEHEDFAPFEIPVTEAVKDKDNKNLGLKLQHDSTCTGILGITVKNINDELLQNVEIRLNRGEKIVRKAYTKETGKFTFEYVCGGEYWLRLAKDGYKVIEQEFSIEDGETKTLDFEMLYSEDDSCCAGIINLTILDSLEGTAIENVKARLWKGDSKIREAYTNGDGKIAFERICDGEYQISIFKEGFYGEEFKFTMECSDTLDITKLMLTKSQDDSCCNGVVYIFVKDSTTNSAIAYAAAKLWKDGRVYADGKTSESGLVTFSNLCEGNYGLSLHHEHYNVREFEFELGCDDTLEIHKTMIKALEDTCCDGQIQVTILDKETKEPVNNALVKLWKNGKIVTKKYSESAMVKFTDLCQGNYFIDVVHEKYKSIEFELTVNCNQNVEINKELEKYSGGDDSCCHGVVIVAPKDKDSKELINGAVVKLWKGDKMVYQETVHEQPLVITNLCAGKYQFSFIAEGYQSAEEDFTLECNDTLEFPFYMQKMHDDTCCDGRLVIIPKDSLTGEVLNGAKVRIWKDGKVVKEGIVEGGMLVFEQVCKGSYGVDIIMEGYKGIEFSLTFDCNEEKNITKNMIKLDDIPCCDGKVIIKAYDNENGDIIHCTIKLMKDGKVVSQKYQEGVPVTFENLCEGLYHVLIVSENYQSIEFDFELGCDEVKTFEKGLEKKSDDCCKGMLYIAVRDSTTDKALAGIVAKLWQGDQKKAYGTTSDGGVVKLTNICEGNYVLTLEGTNYHPREIPIALGCNDTLEMHYKMKAKESVDTCNTAEIHLIVKEWESDVRIPNASVKIYDMEGRVVAEGTSNEEGVFIYSSLKAPKKYKIRAWKDGYDDPYIYIEYTKCERKEAVIQLKKI